VSTDQAAFQTEDMGTHSVPLLVPGAPGTRNPGFVTDGTSPLVDEPQELRVSVHDSTATQQISTFLGRLLQDIDPGESRPLVLVAIGTDRLTGDSLGPLVGSRARELAPWLPIYGTLDEPVHAVNLADTIKKISHAYQEPLVMAVDASLGQARNVGTVSIGRGSLYPGTGVHKDLPPVGEVFISGVVNVGGFLEFLVLQNTRLCLVMQLADCIARALVSACTIWLQQCAAASDTCILEQQEQTSQA